MANTYEEQDVVSLYFNSIKDFKSLTNEEEREYIKNAQENGSISDRNKVVNANLKFVVKIAKEYQNSGVPLIDIISEGNLGLIEAIDHFDLNQTSKFITYAVWWIRQSIIKFLQDKSRLIRLPVNKNNDLLLINKKIEEYSSRNMSIDLVKIAEELDIDSSVVKTILDVASPCASLDQSVGGDDDNRLSAYDLIPSDYANPEESLLVKDERAYIEKSLSKLPEKEREIIRMRYGLGEYGEMSLQDIGEILNITKERVRQLENEALKHIRECAG